MPHYPFLIIGGGMTADAAVKAIREINTIDTIGVISGESHPPYSRPPLSKALWKGEPLNTIWRNTPTNSVEFHRSRLAVRLDAERKTVVDDRGTEHSFNKLLLATGVTVRRLPYQEEGIIYFRTLDDYRNLRELTDGGQKFAVIGGGFIGSEIASALSTNGKSVTMIFPESGIGARIYPRALSEFLNAFYRSKGVEVWADEAITEVEKRGSVYHLRTSGGRTLEVAGVVAGIGVQPNVELARTAGLEIDNGIVVDDFLQTSHPDIFAAGDVANFFNPSIGTRMRVEHEDNAVTMGGIAGRNMAGAVTPYHHLPFFYSDLFELGYEAVGELDARLETVADWKEEFREGVVYYLGEGRVRGVLLWNTWGQVDAARALIAEKGPFDNRNLKGRLPARQA